MSSLADWITEVLDDHPRSDDGFCWKCRVRWTHAHVAERVAEALHLEQIPVKQDEVPPFSVITGWVCGSAVVACTDNQPPEGT